VNHPGVLVALDSTAHLDQWSLKAGSLLLLPKPFPQVR
jgi:hypothetical protein